ncbi:hypothetical protein L210DRAFT_3652937 [Boletus edulis BED1]|uniref:DEK-C domain-containing protein n=1 Tax=Boletus edulis BED1 TaxID=1328754 RepID=A0AAD4BG71_BOLED|nr:hypothetical protein L210DRAFT_3653074 [Boletus edulis BED1]KAF8426481.1 hypothetical protein L210DRAFT_3652937 [Boletus edulis BED1]
MKSRIPRRAAASQFQAAIPLYWHRLITAVHHVRWDLSKIYLLGQLPPRTSSDKCFKFSVDSMAVTKKTAHEAMMAKFPRADLTPRKDFLNKSIGKVLSQS